MRIAEEEPERRVLVVPKPAATPEPERVEQPQRPANEPNEAPAVVPERKRAA